MNTLEVKHVNFSYQHGISVINDITFSVEAESKVALIGCNGAGKSTLLSLLLGVLWPTSGDIAVCDQPLIPEHLAEIRAAIGMVFQNPDDQLFMPTIFEDIAFGPRNHGLSKDEVYHRTMKTMETLGISHLAQKPPYRLSGGEKRTAALATALVMEPRLLMLDEPTAFLDPRTKRTLAALLQRMDLSMLIATHDLDFVRQVCSRVIVMYQGEIVAHGKTEAILDDATLLYQIGL